MTRLLRSGLAAGTAFVLACVILGTGYAAGLVPGDRAYTIELPLELSAAFAFAIGIVAAAYAPGQASDRRHGFLVAAVGAVVGCLYWYLSERLIALRFTGNWQWGFLSPDLEVQAASCWVAAGTSAMLVAFTRRAPTMLVTIAMLCLFAVVLPAPLFNYLYNNQELTVALATPVNPGVTTTRPPEVIVSGSKEFDEAKVAAHVLEALRSSGLPGEYRVTNLYRVGAGKRSLQIIVVSRPVASRALLPEPDGTEVMYVRKPDGWESIPPRAPTLRRSIEIGPGNHGDWLAFLAIPDASGSSLMSRMRSD
jgi:hypothetical protein